MFKTDYTVEEAVRVLSSYGLEEVQKALGLSDDDIVNILLDRSEPWERKIMQWFSTYLKDSKLDYYETNKTNSFQLTERI